MSSKYKVRDNERMYFITITAVKWIDVFARKDHKLVIIDSLKYCQKNKGLEIFAWCLMTNHLHMFCRARKEYDLVAIKKFTSKKIIDLILLEASESKRDGVLKLFRESCAHLSRQQEYKVWQDGYHGEEVFTNKFMYQKLNYIHMNPVKALLVEEPWEYMFSSARNYNDEKGMLDIDILPYAPIKRIW